MSEKFSYSKLELYENCGFRYKLQYLDKHFVNESSIATDFGTLIHFIEETIANDIKANNNEPSFLIDNEKYIDLFINADIHNQNETILGIKKIKEKYPDDFYKPDKSGFNYEDKANNYLNNGIFYLQDFLASHRNLKVIATEKEFEINYNDFIFKGFIDRILYDETAGKYIVEDIKTWPDIGNHKLTTPLQFVIYCLAMKELYGISLEDVQCIYYLPLITTRYVAGTKGFISRGKKKIDNILTNIFSENFEPNPSPLCYWCPFSATHPNQPEEAKNLCPYFCHWTQENKDFSVENNWFGKEYHEEILNSFINKTTLKLTSNISEKPKIIINSNLFDSRITLVRRF